MSGLPYPLTTDHHYLAAVVSRLDRQNELLAAVLDRLPSGPVQDSPADSPEEVAVRLTEPDPDVPARSGSTRLTEPDVPPDGTATVVLAWVGDDPDRAQAAAEAERRRDRPRGTLLAKLAKIKR